MARRHGPHASAPLACALAALVVVFPAPGNANDGGDGDGDGDGDGADASYETVVHGDAVEERRPEDDPAGFGAVLRVGDPRPGTRIKDVVDRVPGVRTTDHGPGARQSISLRGTDSQQVAVFLDGFRLSPAAGGGVDLSLVDPAHLEEVEVRRGGGSARFGTDALGGVIHLRTPRLRNRSRTRASVGYGSWNAVQGRASHSGAHQDLRYLAGASYSQTDGNFAYTDLINGTEEVRLNNDSRRGETLLKADYLVSDTLRVALLDSFSVAERGAPGPATASVSYDARQFDLRNLVGLQLTRYDLLLPGSRLEVSAGYRYLRLIYDRPAEGITPATHSDSADHTVSATARMGLPLGRHGRLDGGVELRGELLRDPQTDDPERLEADLFLAGQWRLAADHLVVVPALRLASASDQGVALAPRVGLVVRPLRTSTNRWLRRIEAAANLGRSYRYPTFQELYIRLDGYSGNPDLKPEDAMDWDVGLRFRTRRIALEVAYFQREIVNTILFAAVSSFLVRPDNYEAATARGVEGSVRVDPGLGLSLRGAYTFTTTRFGDPPVLRMPGRPEHRLVARVDWTYPFTRRARRARRWGVNLGAEVTHESAMWLDRFNHIEAPPRVLLGVSGSVTWRWFTLSATGRNLLDQRDAVDTLGFPLPPAHFFVSLAFAI